MCVEVRLGRCQVAAVAIPRGASRRSRIRQAKVKIRAGSASTHGVGRASKGVTVNVKNIKLTKIGQLTRKTVKLTSFASSHDHPRITIETPSDLRRTASEDVHLPVDIKMGRHAYPSD